MKKIFILFLLCSFAIVASCQNTLDNYLQSAVKNSPLFIDNQMQIDSLSFDSLLLRAGMKPQVNLTSNDFYAPVINGYGYDEIITNKGSYNALVGINYPVIGRYRSLNQFTGITIQKQLLGLNLKLSERDLKQNVTAQYITVFGEQQMLSNAEQVLTVLEKEDSLLKSIAEKGTYRQTDYLSFLVGIKQQQLSYARQKLQMQNDFYLLNYLCGIIDTVVQPLSDPALTISQSKNSENTFSFAQFTLDSLQVQNTSEYLKFHYRPRLNFFGDAGYNTTFLFHAERNFGGSVGLNLVVPIYDGNQRKLQMEKLKLVQNKRLFHIDYFKKQFTIKQLQLQRQISETDALVSQAREQLKLSEALLKANNQLLETGDARIADYLLSLTNYISSQTTTQQLIVSRMLLINQFNYLNY